MADKVSILKRDGSKIDYNTYGNARINAVSADLIQIWATLNEQIILKNGVDIWIAPGVEISISSNLPTITDNGFACICNIYGSGIIINTNSTPLATNNAACNFSHQNSQVCMECDYIENAGSEILFSCISSNAATFHLKCNKVISKNNCAIILSNANSDINFNITKVETGLANDTSTGITAIISRGNGFIKIDEILCRNLGHCLSHRAGEIIANIFKLITVTRRTGDSGATAHISQGTQTQKLILYFDEINGLAEGMGISSNDSIQVTQGTGIFIGRKAFSTHSNALQITGTNTKGYIICNELISSNKNGLGLNSFTNQITLIINYIEGNNADAGAVFVAGAANFILKNAKCKNLASGASSRTFWIIPEGTLEPNITFNNVKIVSNGHVIFFDEIQYGNLDIENFGLFTNKDLDTNIILEIGLEGNFQYVSSPELT